MVANVLKIIKKTIHQQM